MVVRVEYHRSSRYMYMYVCISRAVAYRRVDRK